MWRTDWKGQETNKEGKVITYVKMVALRIEVDEFECYSESGKKQYLVIKYLWRLAGTHM